MLKLDHISKQLLWPFGKWQRPELARRASAVVCPFL